MFVLIWTFKRLLAFCIFTIICHNPTFNVFHVVVTACFVLNRLNVKSISFKHDDLVYLHLYQIETLQLYTFGNGVSPLPDHLTALPWLERSFKFCTEILKYKHVFQRCLRERERERERERRELNEWHNFNCFHPDWHAMKSVEALGPP